MCTDTRGLWGLTCLTYGLNVCVCVCVYSILLLRYLQTLQAIRASSGYTMREGDKK